MEKTKGVRKGAWTQEEDNLLRACIHKYGIGKWHLVPERAGLNRCRKSCRLRWLNYLSPNIKRGSFTEDEVDLILRLHKLLKNRWSLIAGRLPGRTANDVKNYWHTRLCKKVASDSNKKGKLEKHEETTIEVIKPQPRTFSVNNSPRLHGKHISANDGDVIMCAAPPVTSKEGDAAPRECDVGDGDCAAQPYLGDAPRSTMLVMENLDEQAGYEKVSTSWLSLLSDHQVNSILDFPNEEDFNAVGPSSWDCYWDSNLCDFHSLWDLV